MKQSNSLEIANLAQQVLQQHPNNHDFFSNQNIRHHPNHFEDAANCELIDKLLIDFYNATHATLESFQSLIEVQRKIDECNRRLEELKAQLSDSESASTAYLESDVEFRLSGLQQTDENFKQNAHYIELLQKSNNHQENLKKIEELKASVAEIENSEEYQQNLKCMENFESEIKKAQDALTKILSVKFDKKKAYEMQGCVDIASISLGLCLFLAGLAAMSYFSPAAIGFLMALIVGGIPFLASIVGGLLAAATGAFFLAPIVWQILGGASVCLAQLTYNGVYIVAPFFGHAFAAISAICLVSAIKFGIDAYVLKRENIEDFIKQNIQSKIEDHITLFQKNSASQMESNESSSTVLERSLKPC